MNNIKHKVFKDIDINDKFFDSLKEDYCTFNNWFSTKKFEDAFVSYDDDGRIQGFLYLKIEKGCIDDVNPVIEAERILKIGTFKINAHGTKLGEQFIKIIMDYAINEDVELCYLTIYSKQKTLIKLIENFGFNHYGYKGKGENRELVYVKNMNVIYSDVNKDYPLVITKDVNKYILSIYPKYHSVMFPDSILTTENKNIITDVSYTNSIHKIYICTMGVDILNYGDILVLYRTAENGRSAEYSAVATSICVVEEVKGQEEFASFEKFYEYASQYTVFDRDDLKYWFNRGGCKAIKMTYNVALKKRIVRHDLIEKIGLERNQYWGFFKLTDKQFKDIIYYGDINSNMIYERLFSKRG